MNISEETLESWSTGPSATETEKCENAVLAVRKAVNAHKRLSGLDISFFAQGSYRARTNVRLDSDVDICVRRNDVFFADYPDQKEHEDFGNVTSDLSYSDYKDLVGEALSDYFGRTGVTRGNKAFDVHANSYRIDADVVPTFEHRRYTGTLNLDGTPYYESGVAFLPDEGVMVKNWPEKNYANGVRKNEECNRHYKRVVRILKRLRYIMRGKGILAAEDASSFLIECLVWNAPNEAFRHETYTADVRYVLAYLWNQTRADSDCSEWGEVNELKYLFRSSQPWTRQKANDFLQASWDYIGFGLFAASFCLVAILSDGGVKDLWSALVLSHKAIPLVLVAVGLFVSYMWRWRVFRGWLVPFPDISGTWEGALQTTWQDPLTGLVPAPIPVILTVKQSFTKVSCVMRTAEMTSRSFLADFWLDGDEQVRMLGYCYHSLPLPTVQHRSQPHDGTVVFEVVGTPVTKLKGTYWTGRKTTGEVVLTFRDEERLDEFPTDLGKHPVSGK